MQIRNAIKRAEETFPFENFMESFENVYRNISEIVLSYLPKSSKILDFGCGACDKAAVLKFLGYECYACDDLQNNWHLKGDNQKKILDFSEKLGIKFSLLTDYNIPFENNYFDMVMLHSVLEHLHGSPRDLLNELLKRTKDNGYIFITVPNLVNIKKRIKVLFGKSNLPAFDTYYWFPGKWRGHVREYTKGDLKSLVKNLDLEVVQLTSCHQMLRKIPSYLRGVYRFLSYFFKGWADTWLLVAKKKKNWHPVNLTSAELEELYNKYTLIGY